MVVLLLLDGGVEIGAFVPSQFFQQIYAPWGQRNRVRDTLETWKCVKHAW